MLLPDAVVATNRFWEKPMSEDDIELDLQWRARFGEPLPILNSAEIVRKILADVEVPPGRPCQTHL